MHGKTVKLTKIYIDSLFLQSTFSEKYESTVTLLRAIKAYAKVEVTLQSFLNSVLDEAIIRLHLGIKHVKSTPVIINSILYTFLALNTHKRLYFQDIALV